MKRQIVCNPCRQAHPLKKYAGEWNTTIIGKALKDMICDLCGKPIPKGEYCNAESMGLNRTPYFQWEDEYVTKEGGDFND